MASYYDLVTTRADVPDTDSLLRALREIDASAGVAPLTPHGRVRVKVTTTLTLEQLAQMQTIVDTAPATSSALTAKAEIARLPVVQQAIVLALIDQINIIRAALPSPLPAITRGQALAAISQKAETL